MSFLSLFSRGLLAALSAATLTQALSIPAQSQSQFSDILKRDTCTNSADDRSCWTSGFDIDTNYYDSWPTTNNTVTYDFHITNVTCNPDGHGKKMCQLINGVYPGPTIFANWGDKVVVNVHNDLTENGTSIHWHGLRQLNSNEMDGTNGLTECPIVPGNSRTYEWIAAQYGTSWYHSHHTVQYGEGVVGAIVIDGPSTANYDVDLGVLPLSDWHYNSLFELLQGVMDTPGSPPSADNVLVNGSMIDGAGNGQYTELSIEAGKKYKLRFVNTAVDHLFHVSLDNHPFTVVSADFVPVKPYQTTDLKINIGQRYEIVFTADQAAANYWLRVNAAFPTAPQKPSCGLANIYTATNVTAPVVGAIFRYANATAGLPTSAPYANDNTCADETLTVPYLTTPVPSDFVSQLQYLNITEGLGDHGIVNWKINGSSINGSMDVNWEDPTLAFIRDNRTFLPAMNVIEMPKKESWYLWVIENAALNPPIPHPIHLHGHDFEVLGSGQGAFPTDTSSLNFASPMRRDVATLPGGPTGGWLLVAVYTDNPGAWLMHCHISWHASQGFSMQFVERQDEIIDTIGSIDSMCDDCTAWTNFWEGPTRTGEEIDSGL